ncbi:MAG: hypothetical protein A2Z15_04075 [Chloroflexi bacterium RBG_16_50_11]|nr:MAG: hypothetical protein A2Z15_04075 [Chloroflexi bacterium RBG_16_50_11]
MNNPEIDFSTLPNLLKYEPTYHKREDVFFIMPSKPQPATSIDWNGEFWIRVKSETGEVLGLEIEDFESLFLKKYPEIAKVWSEFKPICMKDTKKCEEPALLSFMRIILEFFSKLFKNDPKQMPLALNP